MSADGVSPDPMTSLVHELAHHDLVMVLCTARSHGRGVVRLPDRFDRGRRIVALQVETADQARELFRHLDRPGRSFFVDVERKKDFDLLGVAQAEIAVGNLTGVKPNDLTVDALDTVVVEHFGEYIVGLPVAVYGTGNLAFKFALRLAERGADVVVDGRDAEKVELVCTAINAIVPTYSENPVRPGRGTAVRLLVAAVTAESVIDETWLRHLADGALCIDAGINNLAPSFIGAAGRAGHLLLRLDTRAAGDPLPADRTFFRHVAGRTMIAGMSVVAGGVMGRPGEVIVDRISAPRQVVGIASGTGGLLDPREWTPEQVEAVRRVDATIATSADDAGTD